MEFHLPSFDAAMFWFGAFAVVLTIAFFIREGIRKRRTKHKREQLEKTSADIEKIKRKRE